MAKKQRKASANLDARRRAWQELTTNQRGRKGCPACYRQPGSMKK